MRRTSDGYACVVVCFRRNASTFLKVWICWPEKKGFFFLWTTQYIARVKKVVFWPYISTLLEEVCWAAVDPSDQKNYIEDVYLLLHFRFCHFQEWYFQKCHFQIFSEMIIFIILTLLEKILILTLSRMTLLKVYE